MASDQKTDLVYSTAPGAYTGLRSIFVTSSVYGHRNNLSKTYLFSAS